MNNEHELTAATQRWEDLRLLQQHYSKFEDFLFDVIEDLLRFKCTPLQIDIAEFTCTYCVCWSRLGYRDC